MPCRTLRQFHPKVLAAIVGGATMFFAVFAALPATNTGSNPVVAAVAPPQAHAASLYQCLTTINHMRPALIYGPWGTLAMVGAAGSVCAPYVGHLNARSICWQSRQWWGYRAQWIVRVITWGRYSRC
jgi:hypothetical protein